MKNNRMRLAVIAIAASARLCGHAQQTATDRLQERRPRGADARRHQQARDRRPDDSPAPFGPQAQPGAEPHVHRHRAQRRSSAGHRAVADRHLHLEGLLQGPRALERQALLPLQQLGGARGRVGRQPQRHDRRQPAGVGRVGLLRPRLSARSDRQPVSASRRRKSTTRRCSPRRRSAAVRIRSRRADAARGLDGPLHASGAHAEQQQLVSHAARSGADGAVAADARVSDALRARGVPPRQHEQGDVAVAVLLARGLHAPLARGRRVGAPHHRDAVGRADRVGCRAQLHHDRARRPRVQDGRQRAAPGCGRAALVRRDDRLLGQATR